MRGKMVKKKIHKSQTDGHILMQDVFFAYFGNWRQSSNFWTSPSFIKAKSKFLTRQYGALTWQQTDWRNPSKTTARMLKPKIPGARTKLIFTKHDVLAWPCFLSPTAEDGSGWANLIFAFLSNHRRVHAVLSSFAVPTHIISDVAANAEKSRFCESM